MQTATQPRNTRRTAPGCVPMERALTPEQCEAARHFLAALCGAVDRCPTGATLDLGAFMRAYAGEYGSAPPVPRGWHRAIHVRLALRHEVLQYLQAHGESHYRDIARALVAHRNSVRESKVEGSGNDGS